MIDRWTVDAPPPHGGQPILSAGAPPGRARAALVLLHGRGATAAGILELAGHLAPQAGDLARLAALAPQAAGQTWYPYPFTAPLEQNEPWLSSALAGVEGLLARLEAAGLPAARTVIAGFSQGACLALEFVARHARRYGGVAGLSGGVIGPPGTPRDYPGSLDGTPVFLGCDEADGHIPAGRVTETGDVLRRMGGEVTLRLYPALGHAVNDDEIRAVQAMLAALLKPD